MALQFLLDLLTGNMALVDVPGASTPITPSTDVIPVFFFVIPQ